MDDPNDLVCTFCDGKLRLVSRYSTVREMPYLELECRECEATWGFHGEDVLTTGSPRPKTIIGELGIPEITTAN